MPRTLLRHTIPGQAAFSDLPVSLTTSLHSSPYRGTFRETLQRISSNSHLT